MFKGNNQPRHYKMYKSGKSWVFAGIISAGLFMGLGTTTASADSNNDPTGDTPSGEVASKESLTDSDKSAVLKSAGDNQSAANVNEETASNTGETQPEPPAVPDNTPGPQTPPAKEPVNEEKDEPSDNLESKPVETPTPDDIKPVVSANDNDDHVTGTEDQPDQKTKFEVPMATSLEIQPLAAPAAVEPIDTWMPNKKLQAMVASALGIPIDQLTPKSLASKDFTSLKVAHGRGVGDGTTFINGIDSFDLTGLEFATNLTELDLSLTSEDSTQMSGQRASFGDITSLAPLTALTKLTTLDLSHNRIQDVSPLASLKNLISLNVSSNNISDFSSLDAAQITYLNMNDQIVQPTTVHYIDPNNPTLTLAPLIKLPKNTQVTYKNAFNQKEMYETFTELLSQNQTQDDKLTGYFLFYRSGTSLEDFSLDGPDGTVTFKNIAKQPKPPYTIHNEWDINKFPYSIPVQHPYKYYLRADLWISYTVNGSTTTKSIFPKVFIPYDNLQVAGDLTVHYLDADDKAIQPDKVITDKMTGDAYDLTADTTIKGYTFNKADGELTGTFGAKATTVTLHFTKDATKPVTPPVDPVNPPVITPTPSALTTVTAHYVDENGKTVHDDVVLTGHAGDSYSTPTFNLSNYQLVTTPDNASGTFGNNDLSLTYVYHQLSKSGSAAGIKDPGAEPTTTVGPKTKSAAKTTGGSAAKVTSKTTTGQATTGHANATVQAKPLANKAMNANQSKTTLPQTSDQSLSPLVGVALLLGALIGFGLKRKRN